MSTWTQWTMYCVALSAISLGACSSDPSLRFHSTTTSDGGKIFLDDQEVPSSRRVIKGVLHEDPNTGCYAVHSIRVSGAIESSNVVSFAIEATAQDHQKGLRMSVQGTDGTQSPNIAPKQGYVQIDGMWTAGTYVVCLWGESELNGTPYILKMKPSQMKAPQIQPSGK